ncbi:MAG: hypothetical protein U0K92_11885 [Treponema sp.]|nr:hypothetical protein [Treponema sp.]
MKNGDCGYFYAVPESNGPLFFDNETEFNSAYERDWADETWEGMNDETLKRWINRLSNENDPALQNWAIRNKLNK